MNNDPLINLAKQIDPQYRREILLMNLISKAVAVATDENMQRLVTIWQVYVEPGFNASCNLCYNRLLDNYKQLQPVFVQLEKERELLDSVGATQTGTASDDLLIELLKDIDK